MVKSINLVNLPHGCARGGHCHTDSTDITDFSALLCLQRADAFFFLLLAVLAKSINLVNFFSSGILSGFGVYVI